MNRGTLYLIPCPISGETAPAEVLPAANFEVMRGLDYFIVEDVRSARRFLSQAGVAGMSGGAGAGVVGVAGVKSIDSLEFTELNEHTRREDIDAMLAPLLAGRSAGVISEAGVPAVADPGAEVVAAAHRKGLRVIPLVGPSSILLALMASGANGQSFAFGGYLPVKPPERARAIRFFEKRARAEGQSQIFIETPYRGEKLFAEFLAVCAPETRLTVAVNITAPDEYIRTATIAEWRRAASGSSAGSRIDSSAGSSAVPVFAKRPAIFILS